MKALLHLILKAVLECGLKKLSKTKSTCFLVLILLGSFDFAQGQTEHMIIGTGGQGGGSVFAVNTDLKSLTKLKDFSIAGVPIKGELLDNNGKFWGLASSTGDGYGVIFSIEKDGSNYSIEYNFDGNNGSHPSGGLTLSGGKLWGTTTQGGQYDDGVIFNLNLDGTGFTAVYHMNSSNQYFSGCQNTLIESNGKLWGTTYNGGSLKYGTIFSIDTNGTNFTVVHQFNGSSDGAWATSGLLLSNGKLWGGTQSYGGNNAGTLYNLNTDGTGFSVIHNFERLTSYSQSKENLMESNGRIWGGIGNGGIDHLGIIYSIGTDGTDFRVEHEFAGPISVNNGAYPSGKLIQYGSKLYGTTQLGSGNGSSFGNGIIFSLNLDGTGYTIVHEFEFGDGQSPVGNLVSDNGYLYGLTPQGGLAGITGYNSSAGIIYRIDTTSYNFEKLHNFNSQEGFRSYGGVIDNNGRLVGMTMYGGANHQGVIYSMNVDGSDLIVLQDFDGANGARPVRNNLLVSNGKYFGMTERGGVNDSGVIFRMDFDGSNYTKFHDFDTPSGIIPTKSLLESNGKLWGTTVNGGSNNSGTIFSINVDGSGYTVVHHFLGSANGRYPDCSLIESNGKLWGSTRQGGNTDDGIIFNINLDGTGFNTIHDFEDGIDGRLPSNGLTESGGKLWGVVERGGPSGRSVIFNLNLDGSGFSVVHVFDDLDEGYIAVGELVEANNKLWGFTTSGGTNQEGTLFNLKLDGTEFTKIHDGFAGNMRSPSGILSIEVPTVNTFVPDNTFEQAVEGVGFDDDDFVLTADINTLTTLNIANLGITDLTGVEDFVMLKNLYAGGNALTTVDLSQNTELVNLQLHNNALTGDLDLLANTKLVDLRVHNNDIGSLDISNSPDLTLLYVQGNDLGDLDVSHITALTTLNVRTNPGLHCIGATQPQIDNIPVTWYKDPLQVYNTDCASAYTLVPDVAFEQVLFDQTYDKKIDGRIYNGNVNGVTGLFVESKGISDLTGIEAFTSLQTLYAFDNQLSSVDISQNTALTNLRLQKNDLTAIDVSNNIALKTLLVQENELTQLDLTTNTALETMWCYTNQLTELNLKNQLVLTNMYSTNNSDLVCIEVNDAGSIPAGWNKGLNSTYTTNCDDLYTSIPDPIFEAALSFYDNLTGDGRIPTAKAQTITGLNLSLPASATEPEKIQDLTGIDQFTSLVNLYIDNHSVASLDLTNSPNLEIVYAANNGLTSLDLSGLTQLELVHAHKNQLTEIDVSASTGLTRLYVHYNQLGSMDVSNNTSLATFYATVNPTLSCINIDASQDPAPAGWNKDAAANYNTNCASTRMGGEVSDESKELDSDLVSVYPNPSSGQFTLEMDQWQGVKVEIYDLTGQQSVPSRMLTERATEIKTDKMLPGIKMIRLIKGKDIQTIKLQVQ